MRYATESTPSQKCNLCQGKTSNTQGGSSKCIGPRVLGTRCQCAFFVVHTGFNPLAPNNRLTSSHETERRGQHMHREWEGGAWVFHHIGVCCHKWHGQGSDNHLCTHCLPDYDKRGQLYSQVLGWLCCMLSFSLMRLALVPPWHLWTIQC